MSTKLDLALNLAPQLEELASKHGFHIGLTGGVLYKEGDRKDIDFVLYEALNDRSNVKHDSREKFITELVNLGFVTYAIHRCTTRMDYHGTRFDFIFTKRIPKSIAYRVEEAVRKVLGKRHIEGEIAAAGAAILEEAEPQDINIDAFKKYTPPPKPQRSWSDY